MKIVLTEEQYIKLLLSEGEEVTTVEPVVLHHTGFAPYLGRKASEQVYLNGTSKNEIDVIKKLKKSNVSVDVTLENIQTKEKIVFPIEKIKFNTKNTLYIDTSEYEKIKGTLLKNKINLTSDFLKKGLTGFPEFLRKVLFSVYPNNIGKNKFINGTGECNSENGLINIEGTNVPDQIWSILNFFDTNPKVINQLIYWYLMDEFSNKEEDEITSIYNFQNWIEKNKESLFKGEKLKVLVDLNLGSYKQGVKNQNFAIEFLNKAPFNIPKENIIEFCAGVSFDRKGGKDIIIKFDEVLKSAQIKPLSWHKKDEVTNDYVIGTYSMQDYKSRKVDFIIFVNETLMIIFKNKDYKVLNSSLVVFKSLPVTTLDELKYVEKKEEEPKDKNQNQKPVK